MRRTPPLEWVRSFESAARLGSFSAAARDLNLTQAAVSKHIQNLEAWAARPLFDRLPRGVRLTDAGRAYRPVVTDALERLRIGTEEVFAREHGGALTLRVNAAFCALVLAPRLPRFADAHPGIVLNVLTNVWPTEHLENEVDLEIRYGAGPWPGLRATPLVPERLIVVTRPDTRSADPGSAVRDGRLLHVMGYAQGWVDWLSAYRVARDDDAPDTHFDNTAACLAACEAGLGFALVRDVLAEPAICDGRLAVLCSATVDALDPHVVLGHSRVANDRRAQAFLGWLEAEMADAGGRAARVTQNAPGL